jgi:dTDP-4-dehydrorhamnose reductase
MILGKKSDMKILVLGGTGMLGSAVGKHFLSTKYDVKLTYRNDKVIYGDKNLWLRFAADNYSATSLVTLLSDFDYVINCIGTIKPFMASDPISARRINAIFPWELAKACSPNNTKLLHITTDCVFSGKDGKYVEASLHDALDDYGKSKSLGEPISDCMVIRTSIIGEEIHKNASLIAWAKTQKGKEVKGFTHHLWNGITTNWYAKICHRIITENMYEKGLFHVYASDDVNKFEMMNYFNEKYDLGMLIQAVDNITPPTDRTLRSSKILNKRLNIPSVQKMISEI